MMWSAARRPAAVREAGVAGLRARRGSRAMRESKPRSNKSNVSGPGAMKNTKIQMGQWANR
jgi:hypothetical protein